MDPEGFTYITENDDRFVTNHFERNKTGKYECQHCELVFDNIDKPTMAKHLRRKHPMDTKARLEKAANVNQAEENPTNNREAMENEEPPFNDSVQDDTGRATTHCGRTPEEAEHILNVFADPNGEYKRIGQYSSDEELNESRKKLGFVIRNHSGTITYYHCKNYGSNKPKKEWCPCKAESFNSLLYQKGEHANHCNYRGRIGVNDTIDQQPDDHGRNQMRRQQRAGESIQNRANSQTLDADEKLKKVKGVPTKRQTSWFRNIAKRHNLTFRRDKNKPYDFVFCRNNRFLYFSINHDHVTVKCLSRQKPEKWPLTSWNCFLNAVEEKCKKRFQKKTE